MDVLVVAEPWQCFLHHSHAQIKEVVVPLENEWVECGDCEVITKLWGKGEVYDGTEK